MNAVEHNRPPLVAMTLALELTKGRVDLAQVMLSGLGFTCTRLGFYRRIRTKGLQEWARGLRRQNSVAVKIATCDKENRCRWGFGNGCVESKAETRVDFCPAHQKQHNDYIAETKADRKRRRVCVVCEETLAPTSRIHCTRHLEIANNQSRRKRGKRAEDSQGLGLSADQIRTARETYARLIQQSNGG